MKALRLAGISTLEAAKKCAGPGRRAQVGNSYTVRWDEQKWNLSSEAIRAGLRGSRIRIEQRLDGTMRAWIDAKFFVHSLCTAPPLQRPVPARKRKRFVLPPGRSRWMDGFGVGKQAATATVSTALRSPFLRWRATSMLPAAPDPTHSVDLCRLQVRHQYLDRHQTHQIHRSAGDEHRHVEIRVVLQDPPGDFRKQNRGN